MLNASFRPIESITVDQFENVFIALYNDHPELFWLETSYLCFYDWNGQCVQVDLLFNETAGNLEAAKTEFQQNVGEILEQVQGTGSDYEIEMQVYDLLVDRITYDLDASMNQSAYGAIVNDSTVFAGYARAYQYLMQHWAFRVIIVPVLRGKGMRGISLSWKMVIIM